MVTPSGNQCFHTQNLVSAKQQNSPVFHVKFPRQHYHIQMTGSSFISWLPPQQVFLQTQGMDNNCPCLFPLLRRCNHPRRWLITRIWRLRGWSHSPPGGQDSASILVGSEAAVTILTTWVYLEN